MGIWNEKSSVFRQNFVRCLQLCLRLRGVLKILYHADHIIAARKCLCQPGKMLFKAVFDPALLLGMHDTLRDVKPVKAGIRQYALGNTAEISVTGTNVKPAGRRTIPGEQPGTFFIYLIAAPQNIFRHLCAKPVIQVAVIKGEPVSIQPGVLKYIFAAAALLKNKPARFMHNEFRGGNKRLQRVCPAQGTGASARLKKSLKTA